MTISGLPTGLGGSTGLMLLRTRGLDLFPCSAQVAQAATRNRRDLESLLGVRVPDDWPAPDLEELLPWYAQELETDPGLLGWGIWLMIHRKARMVIGDLGFKGRPDGAGMVEIGYSVLPAYRGHGFASEAVRALVDWALAQQDVRRITAECSVDNTASLRILEKLGMQRLETGDGLLTWELWSRRAGKSK